mmetsp:Transcript_97625/g.304127  ORF Transcript_97625/g.304127 Transcript_97625/m.304127 type:complete len:328 (+) Transcript_97625:1383-2366(+)
MLDSCSACATRVSTSGSRLGRTCRHGSMRCRPSSTRTGSRRAPTLALAPPLRALAAPPAPGGAAGAGGGSGRGFKAKCCEEIGILVEQDGPPAREAPLGRGAPAGGGGHPRYAVAGVAKGATPPQWHTRVPEPWENGHAMGSDVRGPHRHLGRGADGGLGAEAVGQDPVAQHPRERGRLRWLHLELRGKEDRDPREQQRGAARLVLRNSGCHHRRGLANSIFQQCQHQEPLHWPLGEAGGALPGDQEAAGAQRRLGAAGRNSWRKAPQLASAEDVLHDQARRQPLHHQHPQGWCKRGNHSSWLIRKGHGAGQPTRWQAHDSRCCRQG